MSGIKKPFFRLGGFKMATKQVDHREACPVRSGQYLLVICAAVALAVVCAPASKAQIILGPTISMVNLTNNQTIIVGDKISALAAIIKPTRSTSRQSWRTAILAFGSAARSSQVARQWISISVTK
jgi:hypothetical protein